MVREKLMRQNEGETVKKTKERRSNQIISLLLSHHHSTCALMSEILESVLHTVQKQLTYRQYQMRQDEREKGKEISEII